MKWMKLEPIDSALLEMDDWVLVGFGEAFVTKNGEVVVDGMSYYDDKEDAYYVSQAEELARQDPDNDWRIVWRAPLWGETWQRQGDGQWFLVDKNEGFA